jgi:hypothetical protein
MQLEPLSAGSNSAAVKTPADQQLPKKSDGRNPALLASPESEGTQLLSLLASLAGEEEGEGVL